MDNFSWILIGIMGVSLTLYFVFTFAKKIDLVQSITSSLIIPSIGIFELYYLLKFIPDSYHTIKLTALAFFFITISHILNSFFKKNGILFIHRMCFIISIISLIFLYKSVFLIYRIPLWVHILAGSIYIVIFFLFFVIFIKKAPGKFYFYAIFSLILVGFLHYCTFLSLCYKPVNYTITRFIGITTLLAFIIFQLLNSTIINLKLKKLISLLILLASLILISLSNLMIFY